MNNKNIINKNIDEELQKTAKGVGALLKKNNAWISCAESCTGGLLTSTLTDIAGSSSYVRGSVVCYTNEVKEKVLGVSHELLEECPDAVCEEVAKGISEGARKFFGTEIAVGITGIAGPGGGSEEKPVGLVYIGVSGEKGCLVKKNLFSGDRITIKKEAVLQALCMTKDYLSN